jgi:manganese/zinc/iron transport system permease protein
MSGLIPDRAVLEGLILIGVTSGALGCFTFLRRQSLLSDTLAHAALPGVCLAFLITGSKSITLLLLGALVAGVLGSLLFLAILRHSKLKQDVALGIVLTTFFAVGVVLLSMLQNSLDARQSGLKHFILGHAAYITVDQVLVFRCLAAVVLITLFACYKELKLLSFDAEYASTLGFQRRRLELIFAALIVAAVIISLRGVGVVLTVALLVAPAAAARQWTERLGVMLVLAVLIGAASGVFGAFWSLHVEHSPTGPVVVLVATMILGFSLLFAPQRGVLWSALRLLAHRRKVRCENLLTDFYRLGEKGRNWQRPREVATLAAVRRLPTALVERTLRLLERQGEVQRVEDGWRLTPEGLSEAVRVVRNHRLWELYLARRLELALDHVHRDAEAMEHALPPEVVAELEESLENPELDPHGLPIPRAVEVVVR